MTVGEVDPDAAELGERVADWYAEANLARAGTVAELAEGAWAMRTPAYPKSFAHNAVLLRRDPGADTLVSWADDVLADADHRFHLAMDAKPADDLRKRQSDFREVGRERNADAKFLPNGAPSRFHVRLRIDQDAVEIERNQIEACRVPRVHGSRTSSQRRAAS